MIPPVIKITQTPPLRLEINGEVVEINVFEASEAIAKIGKVSVDGYWHTAAILFDGDFGITDCTAEIAIQICNYVWVMQEKANANLKKNCETIAGSPTGTGEIPTAGPQNENGHGSQTSTTAMPNENSNSEVS